ncbi:2,3-dihydro-2,3-dihydroxybenzoate dehydrogenase [Klebsiella pneumoniae]|nr:2,3-dihydro-2,3-dihydroxybenzoate dehydrogenase [Klebsiella pneumoniae]
MDFRGQTVWVTGAGKGIGYATALAFVEAGANVTGFDLAFDGESYPFATETLDVADADQVREACSRLLANTERLDVLVNAAGILRMGATDQLSAEDWQQTFAVNVGGAFNLFQQTMAQFRRQRGGAIVTVASDAAHTPRIGMSAYGASKAALKSLALTVGLELAGSGVRCNLVSPGSTDTDMQRTLWVSDDAEQQRIRGFGEQFKLGIPLGKIARPQEIANTILFLASSHASHITLQDIVVDGGSTLEAEMPVDARTHQPFGLLHGGASAALAETLGSMAGWLMTEEGQCVVGTELNASHHRAVSSGKVRGECRPLHLGRQSQSWEIVVYDEKGRRCCTCRLGTAVLG